MNKIYELTVLFPVTTEEKAAEKQITELLKKTGGKVVKTDSWGKKDLAYPIKKQAKALYLYFEVEASANEMLEFEKRLRLAEEVMRYLLIASDKKITKQAKEEKKTPKAKKA